MEFRENDFFSHSLEFVSETLQFLLLFKLFKQIITWIIFLKIN